MGMKNQWPSYYSKGGSIFINGFQNLNNFGLGLVGWLVCGDLVVRISKSVAQCSGVCVCSDGSVGQCKSERYSDFEIRWKKWTLPKYLEDSHIVHSRYLLLDW